MFERCSLFARGVRSSISHTSSRRAGRADRMRRQRLEILQLARIALKSNQPGLAHTQKKRQSKARVRREKQNRVAQSTPCAAMLSHLQRLIKALSINEEFVRIIAATTTNQHRQLTGAIRRTDLQRQKKDQRQKE